jgi:hypothetical protein
MPKHKTKPPPSNYIAYFTLCQELGGRLQDLGKSIAKSGVYAPAFHKHIMDDLEEVAALYRAGTKAILKAQEQWRKPPATE